VDRYRLGGFQLANDGREGRTAGAIPVIATCFTERHDIHAGRSLVLGDQPGAHISSRSENYDDRKARDPDQSEVADPGKGDLDSSTPELPAVDSERRLFSYPANFQPIHRGIGDAIRKARLRAQWHPMIYSTAAYTTNRLVTPCSFNAAKARNPASRGLPPVQPEPTVWGDGLLARGRNTHVLSGGLVRRWRGGTCGGCSWTWLSQFV